MTYVYKFICDLTRACGAVITIKTDKQYWVGSGFIKCPVCQEFASYKGKE